MRKHLPLSILMSVALAGAVQAADFVTNMSGTEEVPPRDTKARATAVFEVADDGLSLSYKLVLANIDNVTASHIHLGAAGVNAPVVAFLYGNIPAGGGPIAGKVAEGTITAADLVGPLAGQPLSALLDAMAAGGTNDNVHTNDGIDPINTGAGDFPGGEVRGQIRSGE